MATYDDDCNISVDHEKLGDKLKMKAYKKAKAFNLEGETRYYEAIDIYEQAMIQYNIAEAWPKAVDCVMEQIAIYEKHFMAIGSRSLGTDHQLAKFWEQAGDISENYNTAQAIKYWEKAAYHKQSDNEFSGAAMMYRRLAVMFIDRNDITNAMQFYSKAADSFKAGGMYVNAQQCYAQQAQCIADSGDYRTAADYFMRVATSGYATAETLGIGFKALLCILVYAAQRDDNEHAVRFDQDMVDKIPRWLNSYERGVLRKLIEAQGKGRAGLRQFTKACSDYDTVSGLDTWTTGMMLRIKRCMQTNQFDYDSEEEREKNREKNRQYKVLQPVNVVDVKYKHESDEEEEVDVVVEDDISSFFDFDDAMHSEMKANFDKTQSEKAGKKLL